MDAFALAESQRNGGKWSKWEQTMELKFYDGALYQKWYRYRYCPDTRRRLKQSQWRPVRGQRGITDIKAGGEDEA